MTAQTQELLREKLRAKNVLRYMLLPGFIPQIKELAGSGFGYFAFLIASVYNSVRILPANHPYLNPSNIGKFGLRDVLAAAANNITVNRNNWDQIVIFVAVLAGILLLALQFIALIIMIFSGQAFAQSGPGTFSGMFTTPAPTTDLAFQMLDHTFGIPGFFGSNAPTGTPFHLALHQLFYFYNLAILVVAVVVFLYYVVIVVAETAQTGTPFGKRFAHIYAPIRLVVAIGLLVPYANGLNGAQYITLYAAKIGSSFATNGWILFNSSLSNPTGAPDAALIGYPEAPNPKALIAFMSVARACKEAYRINESKDINAYFFNGSGYTVMSSGAYSVALAGAEEDYIEIKFGEDVSEPGAPDVRSFCGSVAIPINMNASGPANQLQERYFQTVYGLWINASIRYMGEVFAAATYGEPEDPCSYSDPMGSGCTASEWKPQSYRKENIVDLQETAINTFITSFIDNARTSVSFDFTDAIRDRGWGGAGIWYSKIAEINGAYTVAVINFPHEKKQPEVLEYILTQKRQASGDITSCKMFEPNLPEGEGQNRIRLTDHQAYYGAVMDQMYQYWKCQETRLTLNIFWDSIQAIFGLNGLFDVRQSATYTDASGSTVTVSVHPLAQLTLIGKSLVESAIRNMAMAMGTSFFGGATGILGQNFAGAAQSMSGFFVSIATIGLSMGFILFYILPLLPFIYFFFAVGAWVKSIFEAMCAAPLWALAHLRIDGEGLPGKNAANGYYLILEIFLRPILTVFGLVAGMATFVALAMLLNEIFDLVVVNVTGNPLSAPGADTQEFGRHLVDQFFFTIVYAVILYMMGISSFKMINLVPNNILRWLGSGATAFGDNIQDPTQGLGQYAAIGGMTIGGQLAGGFTQLGQGVGSMTNIAAPQQPRGGS